MDGNRSIDRIADVLRPLNADVICLQEVNRRLPWSGFEDQPARLTKSLGMRALFQGNYKVGIGAFGNAILTALPVSRRLDVKLPNPRERASILRRLEGRGMMGAEVFTEGVHLLVLCTHWSLDPTDRSDAVSAVAPIFGDHAGPVVFAGDFNALDDTPEIRALIARIGLTDAGAREKALTYPSVDAASRIDYIWHTEDVRVDSLTVVESTASDHKPVVADLTFLDPHDSENLRTGR